MAETHDSWTETSQPLGRLAISRWVGRKDIGRFVETDPAGDQVHVEKHVSQNQHVIRLAVKGEMTGAMPGHFEDTESADDVSFVQHSFDGMARPNPKSILKSGDPVVWVAVSLDDLARLHCHDVANATPQRHAQLLTDLVARSLMIGMCMRQSMGTNGNPV